MKEQRRPAPNKNFRIPRRRAVEIVVGLATGYFYNKAGSPNPLSEIANLAESLLEEENLATSSTSSLRKIDQGRSTPRTLPSPQAGSAPTPPTEIQPRNPGILNEAPTSPPANIPIQDEQPSHYDLNEYNKRSEVRGQVGDGAITWYWRDLEQDLPPEQKTGATMNYVIAFTEDKRVGFYPLTADDATITMLPDGKRQWSDGGNHLEKPSSMAQRNMNNNLGRIRLFITTDYFSEGVGTYPEGPLVKDGNISPNPQRMAMCYVEPLRLFVMNLFTQEDLQYCTSAYGGGPIVVWRGNAPDAPVYVANPSTSTLTPDGFGPFNVAYEHFTNLSDRIAAYQGTRPKTMSGVGRTQDGRWFFMVASSDKPDGVPGITGQQMAIEMRNAGCISAMMHDGGSQTSWLWYPDESGNFEGFEQDPVPAGLGIYYNDALIVW